MTPRRKTRSMTNTSEPAAKAPRKKATRDETNIDEWVYRFLGNLAAIEKDKEEMRQRSAALKTTNRSQSSKAARLRVRSPTPYAWSPRRHHPIDSDHYDFEEEDELITQTSKARIRAAKTLPVNGQSVVHRDPTLLQINRYIRAGIAEGKRRAKRYVRKALSFAIDTGYLVPTDRDGKLLRVSPALVAAGKPLVAARRPRRRQSGRTEGVRGRANGRVTKISKAKGRKASDGQRAPVTVSGVSNAEGEEEATATNAKRKRSEASNESTTASREQPDKLSGGSRKSSGRPTSSRHSSPSRRSHHRPIKNSTPVISRAGSVEADGKPLSARSKSSSFARRSQDDDLFA